MRNSEWFFRRLILIILANLLADEGSPFGDEALASRILNVPS